jgi:hypothetical protein
MMIHKTLWAVGAVATGAAMLLALLGVSPQVEAGTGTHHPAVKADRLEIGVVGAACSQQAWPYYETRCLRDRREAAARPSTVRVIAIDNVTRTFDLAGK